MRDQQGELAASFLVLHYPLHAAEIGMHDRDGGGYEFLVQRVAVRFADEFGADVAQQMGLGQLGFEAFGVLRVELPVAGPGLGADRRSRFGSRLHETPPGGRPSNIRPIHAR